MQSHDYIAMERLYEIHASGSYDLIVVDTPPTRNAIDFLEAPERMADFFSQPPAALAHRSRPAAACSSMASKPFYSVADRILGSKFLEDIAEFFLLFQTMYDGFVERADAVTRTLADERTTFVVVSTLESAPVARGRVLHRRPRRAGPPPRRRRAQQGAAALVPRPRAPRARRRRCCATPADARRARCPSRPRPARAGGAGCSTRSARAS